MANNVKHCLTVIISIDTDRHDVEPGDHVASALKGLLEDHAYDWVSEAIGYPHPESFDVFVKSDFTIQNNIVEEENDGEASKKY